MKKGIMNQETRKMNVSFLCNLFVGGDALVTISCIAKQGSTFFPALIADTIRALNIPKKTLSKYLEQCVSLLQLWFLEQIIAYRPLVTKSLFQEDLI